MDFPSLETHFIFGQTYFKEGKCDLKCGEIEKIKFPIIESIANALEVNPMWIIGKSDNPNVDANKVKKVEPLYYDFAAELQEKGVTKDEMKKMLQFYEMIKKDLYKGLIL